jgi:outer membrane protein OmpA-like peptidoglycan-associated protein
MRKIVTLLLVSILAVQFISCASMSKSTQGTAIGAAAGAGIGAVIGGAAGAYIGRYMDKQAEEIQGDIEGAKVERVGEGIKITFKSGLLFNTGEATLQEQARTDLVKLSATLNKYADTKVLIEGHTDDVGSDEFNMDLSQKRAQAVAAQLSTNQVDPARCTLMGYGEAQPVMDNDSPDGRQANRRVELAIFANDKLKKAAESQSAN